MRTHGVLGVSAATSEQSGLRVTHGPFALERTADGWQLHCWDAVPGENPVYTVEELRQLGEAIKLVTSTAEAAEPLTPADVQVDGAVDGVGLVDEARSLFQERAEVGDVLATGEAPLIDVDDHVNWPEYKFVNDHELLAAAAADPPTHNLHVLWRMLQWRLEHAWNFKPMQKTASDEQIKTAMDAVQARIDKPTRAAFRYLSIHTCALTKLKELQQSSALATPIAMLQIGDECVPDRTFAGAVVDDAYMAKWRRDIWPLWKLHEDKYVVISLDGKTAEITNRGRQCLVEVEAFPDLVYGDSGFVDYGEYSAAIGRSQPGLVFNLDDGDAIPYEWVKASYDIRQVIAVGGDPKVIADGLWIAAQGLGLTGDDVEHFADVALGDYDRADAVLDDIEERLGVTP